MPNPDANGPIRLFRETLNEENECHSQVEKYFSSKGN
jgi:hypothetical protein